MKQLLPYVTFTLRYYRKEFETPAPLFGFPKRMLVHTKIHNNHLSSSALSGRLSLSKSDRFTGDIRFVAITHIIQLIKDLYDV